GYMKGIVVAQNYRGYYLYRVGNYHQAEVTLKKALQIGREYNLKSDIASICLDLGGLFRFQSKYDVAGPYYEEALQLYEELADKDGISSATYGIGAIYLGKDRFDEAVLNMKKSLAMDIERKDSASILVKYQGIGVAYRNQGDILRALDYYLKSIDLAEKLQDSIALARSHLYAAYVYEVDENYEKAMSYLQSSLLVFEELNYKYEIASVYDHIGGIYKKQGMLSEALDYYLKSQAKKEEMRVPDIQPVTLIEIGKIYAELEEYDTADSYVYRALSIAEEIENRENIANAYITLGMVRWKANQPGKARPLLQKGIEICKETEGTLYLKQAYFALYEVEKALALWQESLTTHEVYHAYYDTILNEEKSKHLSRLEVQFETKRKEQEIESLSQQATIQSLQLKSTNQSLTIMAVVLVALLLLGFIFFLYNQRRQLQLKQKSQRVEQRLLRSQMNPHFIFNAMTAVQRQIVEGNTENAEEYLTKFSKLIRQVLENSRSEYISFGEEIQMLDSYMKLHQASIKDPFTYHIEIDSKIEQEELMIPPMFAQPFIENAIEHGVKQLGENGKITVAFNVSGEMLELRVEDNGPGIVQKEQTKYKSHKSLATQITHERINLFRKQMKKDINFNIKNLDPGTQVIFNLPFRYT
ncbi:MAG: tetratricopeptide repeat protein, partial [Bacteroidota bacterium]